MRQLFETLRYGRDKEQLKRVMGENQEAYSNIDRDTKELLEVVAKVKIPEGYKVMKDGEERFVMCKAFEDYRLEGKQEGKLEKLVQQICKKILKNKSAEMIAEELEEDLSEIERVIAAQKKAGSYDVERICEML